MSKSNFEWNEAKNLENQEKHGVSFYDAQHAFKDEQRVIGNRGQSPISLFRFLPACLMYFLPYAGKVFYRFPESVIAQSYFMVQAVAYLLCLNVF